MKGQENNQPAGNTTMRLFFGILMVLIYLGVGMLFIFNIFDIIDHTISIIIGALLVAYGIWRGYRLYAIGK